MPKKKTIVTNTTPIISLTVATGGLEILEALYDRVVVPYEVQCEILAGGQGAFGVDALQPAPFLDLRPEPVRISPYLLSLLDSGEASVIQTALDQGLRLVCIDETAGRRAARLSQLELTGSVGLLIKAHKGGFPIDLHQAFFRMRTAGIWLSDDLIAHALTLAKEQT